MSVLLKLESTIKAGEDLQAALLHAAIWREHRTSVANAYDIALHVGPPKSGTSTLQAFLRRNRRRLKRAGFYYPRHGLDRNRISGGHHKLGELLRDNEMQKSLALLDKWMLKATKRRCCLLLSAESFAQQANRLKNITAGLRVRVIAYFRNPLQTLISGYNQAVKRSFMTMALDDFFEKQLASEVTAGWMKIASGAALLGWAEAFGRHNISALPLLPSTFPSGRIEYSMLSTLGVGARQRERFSVASAPVNVSYTPKTLELKRLLNFVLDKEDNKLNHRIDLCLQSYSDGVGFTSSQQLHNVDKKALSLFEEKMAPTVAELRKTLFAHLGDAEWQQLLDGGTQQRSAPAETLSGVLAKAFKNNERLLDALRQLTRDKMVNGGGSSEEIEKLSGLLAVGIVRHSRQRNDLSS